MTKVCTKCKIEKPLNEFGKDSSTKDGYRRYCKECISIFFKKWRESNIEKDKKRVNFYHEKNKEERKKYRKLNSEKIKIRQRNYQRDKRKNNVEYKLSVTLRKRINNAFKNNFNNKLKSIDLLDCTIEQFKKHLESQFKDGMSWSNYGEWEIDHIIPISSFDLTNIEEQKKAFNYKNTQPLWKIENRRKKDKII